MIKLLIGFALGWLVRNYVVKHQIKGLDDAIDRAKKTFKIK